MTGLLEGKTAIVSGAGGALGGGVARTFAREGATVHADAVAATDVAAFLASERSSGMTAAIANVTCGLVG